MPDKPTTYRPGGHLTKQQRQRLEDRRRGPVSKRGPYQTKWWQATRLRIARRDMYQCKQCGKDVGKAKGDFTCDHKEPRPIGAPIDTDTHDNDANLWTLCTRCDARKRGRA